MGSLKILIIRIRGHFFFFRIFQLWARIGFYFSLFCQFFLLGGFCARLRPKQKELSSTRESNQFFACGRAITTQAVPSSIPGFSFCTFKKKILYLLFEKLEIGNKSERKVLLTLKTDQGELRPTLRQMGKQGRQRSQKGGQSTIFLGRIMTFFFTASHFFFILSFPEFKYKMLWFYGEKRYWEKVLEKKKKSNEFLFFVVWNESERFFYSMPSKKFLRNGC